MSDGFITLAKVLPEPCFNATPHPFSLEFGTVPSFPPTPPPFYQLTHPLTHPPTHQPCYTHTLPSLVSHGSSLL